MEKFKGTPGPWRVSEKRGDLIDIRYNDSVVGAISLNLAHVVALQSWLKEAEANAKLIAAAPELLEALQRCESVLSNIPLEVSDVEDLLYARAAINKALGE